jgi:lysozyme
MTPRGKKMICSWEGLVLAVYLDSYGYPTAGWGHKLTRAEQAQHPVKSPITQGQADAWLETDTAWVDAAIDKHVHVELNANQRAALECLVYNTGAGVLTGRAPKLMAALNRGDFATAANEFLDICHATDAKTGQVRVDRGLQNRRKAERAAFLTPPAFDLDPELVLADVGASLDDLRTELAHGWLHDRNDS